jgi:signal transduction histidine kinase
MKSSNYLTNRFKNTWSWLLDLSVIEWLLPTFLASTAITFELVEHLNKDEWEDPGFIGEVIIFGLLGPYIIRVLLVWMHGLMNAEKQATAAVIELNRELENKVTDRTAALAQRNEELDRANTELRALDQMKSDFVSLVSHELRAPLTALNGGLELALQSSENLPPRSRAILEIIMDESSRLTNFVQTILDVSRLDAGKLAINFGPVAVLPLMEQAATVVLASGQRKVIWDISSDLPPIWADETYLEQILQNLISNANKYSPISKPIHLCATKRDDKICISVKDHGPGIPSSIGDRIFTRFSRFPSTESSPPGWGLGLYLGRKLVEAQNSTIGYVSPIWHDEADAPGSEFYILMPIASTPEDEAE